MTPTQIDGIELIEHRVFPFVDSTNTTETTYKNQNVRAVFKKIKQIGESTVLLTVFIDDAIAAEFVF